MWIFLLLPLIDVLTDHIFAFLNATQSSSQAVAAIGIASLLNLAFGPMMYGQKFVMTLLYSIRVSFSWRQKRCHYLGILSLFGNLEDFISKVSILVLELDFWVNLQQYVQIGFREQILFLGKKWFFIIWVSIK